jgi:IS30 family transposase
MNYQQLIDSQRYQIAAYLKANFTITRIAIELGVHKSTICRELKRNSKKRSYNANYASTLSKERKRESPLPNI